MHQRYIRPSSLYLAKLASSIVVAEQAGDASTMEHPHLPDESYSYVGSYQ